VITIGTRDRGELLIKSNRTLCKEFAVARTSLRHLHSRAILARSCLAFTLAFVGFGSLVRAQDAQSYSFDTDPTAAAFKAPGVPEGSVFAGFGDGESVSLQNGNLLISHPTGPSIPLDGGGSLQLVRSYNAKNVRHDYVHWDPPVDPPEGWGYTESHIYRFQGRSWVGSGWTLHLGRLFWKSRFTTNGYGATDQYFEDPQGTQIGLEDHMRPAHPVLRVEFAQDDGEEWQCPSGEWYCGAECEDPFFIPPGFCTCDCTITTAGGPHYDVKMSDGTVYRMEKIVESVTEGGKGWIGNSDRAGYYTRSITDPYGNVIRVEYEGDETTPGPYPEAIREIWVDPYGAASVERKVIWTDLWEPGDPGYVAAKEGTLRALHAYGPTARSQPGCSTTRSSPLARTRTKPTSCYLTRRRSTFPS
jgi:hypothetical protein